MYNDKDGKPDDVFYSLIANGLNVGDGRYQASSVIHQHSTFSSLLDQLLTKARSKLLKK